MIPVALVLLLGWFVAGLVAIARVSPRSRFANRESRAIPAAWIVRELPSIAGHPTRISGPVPSPSRVAGCRVSPHCTEESCRWR